MQGIKVNGQWPKSKKLVKEAIAADPRRVRLVATSNFGGDHDGSVATLPPGKKVHFAGPNVYAERRFYGIIERVGEKVTVR